MPSEGISAWKHLFSGFCRFSDLGAVECRFGMVCPLGAILLWVKTWVKGFFKEISAQTDSCKPASVSDAVLHEWTLPRAKKVSPGHFFAEVSQLPPPSSSPCAITKKRQPAERLTVFFGCGGRTRTYDLRVMSGDILNFFISKVRD